MADEDEGFKYDFDFEDPGGRPRVGEVLKRIFAVGTTAALLTEESLRSYLGDVKLPKDILNLLVQGAQRSKEELMSRVGKEITTILSKVDIVKEASRFVETHKFKVSAEIEVTKKDS